ncbi:hypothetical protein [Cyclobacterium jeungdonense]|uniref:Uncharacterized protein n=1 Tax=Cyclobacterium jeungdonense TaxID=708087 RepID=A0ABT8C345_9BACT|nr:hypothetical protein [Cyclobacterium jeungdonense]MDN3686792.1 hypothetical protein [Cyclobacterium jeungdonense]
MNKKEVDNFEKYQTQLEGLLSEIGVLAKKSPNDGVNKFKLIFINEVIQEANTILGDKYKPFDSFNEFDEDELPSNSDVTFIMSQYLNCFEKLRADNIYADQKFEGNRYVYNWFWRIDGKKSDIKTAQPKKIK